MHADGYAQHERVSQSYPVGSVSVINYIVRRKHFRCGIDQQQRSILQIGQHRLVHGLLRIQFRSNVSVAGIGIYNRTEHIRRTEPGSHLDNIGYSLHFLVGRIFRILRMLVDVIPCTEQFRIEILVGIAHTGIRKVPRSLRVEIPVVVHAPVTDVVTGRHDVRIGQVVTRSCRFSGRTDGNNQLLHVHERSPIQQSARLHSFFRHTIDICIDLLIVARCKCQYGEYRYQIVSYLHIIRCFS